MAMILASALFGYTMSSVTFIIASSNDDLNDFHNKIGHIQNFIKAKNLSLNLQSRVKNYLEWLAEGSQLSGGWEQQMIS